MEQEKILLGKMLGEIYRIQKHTEDMTGGASDSHIYELLNGFEDAIEEELNCIGFVSHEKVKHTMDVLNEYCNDKQKLEEFKGFYDIENKLEKGGVSRIDAIIILKSLKANDQYNTLIDKMNSPDSPTECKDFNLSEYET